MKPDFVQEVPIQVSKLDNLDEIRRASRDMAAKGAKKVSYTDLPDEGVCIVQGWLEKIDRADKSRSYERMTERAKP